MKNNCLMLSLILLASASISQGSPTTTPADCKVVAPGPDTGATCIFPFTWSATGKTYNECAFEPSKGDTYAWCSTLVDASGNHVDGGGHWGKCHPDNCPRCDDPKPPKHGSWFCQDQSCHLECEPGYAAKGRTQTNRRGNNCDSWTVHPNKMKCTAAVALVIGGLLDATGAEVYGPWRTEGMKPKCHYRLPDLPDTRVGATLDYVDSFFIACGGSMITGPPKPPFPPARNTCIQMKTDKTWTNHSTMNAGRDLQSSAVNLGKLTLLGGTDAPTSRDTLEPAKSSKWTEDTIKETKYACTAKLSPTEFMVSGGEFNPAEVLKYNVVTGEITPLTNLTQERSGHGCAFVKHKGMVGVMVAGGLPQGGEEWTEDVTRATTDHAEFYNMKTGKWEVVGKLNEARRGIRLVFVKNTLYAMGGFNGEKYVTTVESFCFETKTWSKVEDMLAARAFPGVVAVPQTRFKCKKKN